jgi:hypothetical protein
LRASAEAHGGRLHLANRADGGLQWAAATTRATLILLVIPARRFTTAEWLVKPESILILLQWNQGQMDPGVCRVTAWVDQSFLRAALVKSLVREPVEP